ncbi:MAG TPA: PHP domain-containing protein [Rectinema sp.]|nr:PHP domain-containing protein [Rectinema sp.]
MLSNLHLHSRFSDGMSWPEDIALEAARAGLDIVALTDHDTMGGTERFIRACETRSLKAIPACEIDIYEPQIEYRSELLAYFPEADFNSSILSTKCILQKALEQRRSRLEFFIESAKELYPDKELSFQDFFRDKTGLDFDEELARKISWSKVDLFLYLKAHRCIRPEMNYKEFKKKFFVGGLLKKFKLDKPEVATVVKAVHGDGGFVVIPHLGHFWDDELPLFQKEAEKLRLLLAWFRHAGVDGVELYWYNGEFKSSRFNEQLREIAKPQGFFFTYGSDCHGPGSGKHTIMKFKGPFDGFPQRKSIS